jgi:predicted NUDIX family NTP pyrophosphohydrolase
MSKQSAGLLLFRLKAGEPQVLIGHPGGPFYARKDEGVWSIPKGEFEDEEPVEAAKREFQEETGADVPEGEYIDLGSVKNKSGKTIYAWAVEADLDESSLKCNEFVMEWPPKSGQQQTFPEIDRFEWFSLADAKRMLASAQAELVDRLAAKLGADIPEPPAQVSLL